MNGKAKAIRVFALVAGAVAVALAAVFTMGPTSSLAPAPLSAAPQALPGILGPTFQLRATEGRISTPDGNSIYMWGFADDTTGGHFQYPAPTLIVNQGDTVEVTLTNDLSTRVSIAFPGQTDVMVAGAPVQPELDGSGNLVSLTKSVAPSATVTYSFEASEPGTYVYESGTDPATQVQMGLFGALVVRPSMGASFAYNDGETEFAREYLMLLHEIDPLIHEAVEEGLEPDLAAFWPRYWTINGRAFPDTAAGNDVAWLPGQPYGATVVVEPFDATGNPLPALIRFANAGVHNHPFHTHSNHVRVVAHDGQLLRGPAGEDLSREEFTLTVGAGQTYDALFTWTDVSNWDPVTNPLPVQIPDIRNLAFTDGTLYSGSPYLGEKGDLPVGIVSLNECGEYYFPWHTHSEREMVNWGGEMGGMLTLLRVDPPGGCP